MVRNALRFVLAQDISVVILGLKSIEEVEKATKVGEEHTQLTRDEKEHFRVALPMNHCRDCGVCLPCPQNLDIPAILRFHILAGTYGLKNWAKKLYSGLEIRV